MSLYADLYNKVVAEIDTAVDTGTLQYIKSVHRGIQDRAEKGNLPSLTIFPLFAPDELWVAVPNRRQGIMGVVIGIMQEPTDLDFPFGQTTPRKEGLLVTLAEVQNVIDNMRDDFIVAVPKLSDLELVANDPIPIGENVWIQEIVIRFKYRAVAGNR